MTTATTSVVTAEQLAELLHVEYRARVLLDAAHRVLDAVPDDQQDDDDRSWIAGLYASWTAALDDVSRARGR